MWDRLKSAIEGIAIVLLSIAFVLLPAATLVVVPLALIVDFFPFKKVLAFIDEYTLVLIIFSLVCLLCVIVTLLINRYLKNKYKTDYDTFIDQEKEFEAYRENELRLIDEKQNKLNQERSELYKEHCSNQPPLHKSILYDYLKDTLVFQHIATHDYLEYNRFYNYLHDEYKNVKHDIKSVTITAEIKGKAPKSYNTTLNECDCYDFKNTLRRKEPCKHMYMLAYELALLNELPHQEIKKELALATHKYTKAVQEYNKINKTK